MTDTFSILASESEAEAALDKHIDFHMFYPRRVITPPGYLNVKQVSLQFFWAFAEGKLSDVEQLPSSQTLRTIGKHLLANSFQTFWVGRELGADLLNTRPPVDIKFMDFPWPFTAFTFMLPYGLFLTGLDEHVPYITMSVFDGRLDFVLPIYKESERQFYSSTFVTTDKCFDLSDVLESGVVDSAGHYVSEDKQRTLVRALNFASNVVFYMASEGASVESSVQIGKAKKKNDNGLWSPKWVGQYHKRERIDGGGTHASPRTHWRRGHWRNQRFGEGRADVKRLWIRPMMIAVSAPLTPSP